MSLAGVCRMQCTLCLWCWESWVHLCCGNLNSTKCLPMMTMKHKMASLSVDYAKREQEKRQAEKAAAKKKNSEAKAKAKEEGKKEK